jgi:hypothetical protein
LETTIHSFKECNPISIRSILNPIEDAQESHKKFTNEDLVEMVATTGEEKEEIDDNQDEKVVATTTMTEKLKAFSLILIMFGCVHAITTRCT